MIVLQVITRLLAFVGKEISEVARRPAGLASLVLGPFVIVVIFGLGYGGYGQPLTAVIVVPPQSDLPTNIETYREFEDEGITIQGVTRDVEEARTLLRNGQVEVAIVTPVRSAEAFENGEQSVIGIEYAMTNPIRAGFAQYVGRQLSAEVNREIIRRLVEEGQTLALREAGGAASEITDLPPEVVAAPTRSETTNLAPTTPTVVAYYGPALLALILQHLAMTLAGMSIVRERTTGAIELFRIAPVSATEIIVGKLLGYGALVGVVAAATFALLIGVVDVPNYAGILPVAGVIALLTIASVGIGLLLGVISDSERQVIQLTLLLLLASIFFSGLIVPVADFIEPVQALAYLLPATHVMNVLQELMLTGRTIAMWQVGALAIMGVVGLGLSWLMLRRGMTRA
jgi:ABC-2 type transport system permease protein